MYSVKNKTLNLTREKIVSFQKPIFRKICAFLFHFVNTISDNIILELNLSKQSNKDETMKLLQYIPFDKLNNNLKIFCFIQFPINLESEFKIIIDLYESSINFRECNNCNLNGMTKIFFFC